MVSLFKSRRFKSEVNGDGKTAVITGGSAGIGKETAKDFARRGFRVVLACRNLEKTQKVIDEIISDTGKNNITVYKLDTSDMQSVRDCAKQILSKEDRIDILVNNAGIVGSTNNELTKDGFEQTMATNYYGHFLFTNLLIELIKKSAPSRIVNVSSLAHTMVSSLDVENMNSKRSVSENYSNSKLCNILFTLEVSKRLQGTGVTANSLHPGLVSTDIFESTNSFLFRSFKYMANLFGKTEMQGAQTTIYVSISEDLEKVTGKYFDNCKETRSSSLSRDSDLATKLWTATVRDLRMKPEEIKI